MQVQTVKVADLKAGDLICVSHCDVRWAAILDVTRRDTGAINLTLFRDGDVTWDPNASVLRLPQAGS